MTEYQDVIAGFVDSELVEADALAAALARPEGREYLIDLLVLRGLVGDASVVAGRASRAATVAGKLPTASSKPRALWLTMAALLAVGVTAGFLAGRLMFVRGPVTELRAASDVVTPSSSAAAPAPTHVIRMEKGVDWNERSGGN